MGLKERKLVIAIYILLITFVLRFFFSLIFFSLGRILKKKIYCDREYQRVFECGFRRKRDFRLRFSLHFFLVALIFIIFDVELIVIFPFFVYINLTISFYIIITFIVFVFLLALGLLNE